MQRAFKHYLKKFCCMRSADNVVGILTTLRAVRSGVRIWMVVSSSKTSKVVLRPTQPPIQLVLSLFPLLNRPGCEVNYWPASSVGLKNGWSHTSTSLYFKIYR